MIRQQSFWKGSAVLLLSAIAAKVLADEILTDISLAVSKEWNVNGEKVTIGVEKVNS